jgi:hypothetical protein
VKKSFTYRLLGTGPNGDWPYVVLPFDVEQAFGKKGRLPVKVTVGGVQFRMTLAIMGKEYILGFKRDSAEKAKIKVGDTVRLVVERDDEERTVEIPDDLAKDFKKNAAAKKAWEALAYSHRKEHAEAITSAKRPETRAQRIEKTLTMLTTTGRPAAPKPSTKPLVARLRIQGDTQVAMLAAPPGFSLGVATKTTVSAKTGAVLLFAKNGAALKTSLPKVVTKLAPTASLWVAYPKTTSGVKTDLTRDAGWGPLERQGYGAVAQVAIDETWSALRFVRRS